MKKAIRITTLLMAAALMAVSALAAEPSYEEGTHYKRLTDPVPVRDRSKIEVAEVFSYSCGHCFNFEPLIQEWKKTLPEDVGFDRVHVTWDKATENLARAFYTADALGVTDKINQPLFQAIHMQHKRLNNKEQLGDFFAQQGVDRAKFDKTFDSFGVSSQLRQGNSKITGAHIAGTPSLIVGGRYVIEPGPDVNHETMLKVADYLVDQIRKERGG